MLAAIEFFYRVFFTLPPSIARICRRPVIVCLFDTDYRLVSGITIIRRGRNPKAPCSGFKILPTWCHFIQQYLEIILLHYLSLAELAKVCVDK